MKITKSQLKQFIKEELGGAVDENMYAQEGIGQFMAKFQRRLQAIDNKHARDIMKSIRELVQLNPEIQNQALEELTEVLARDSDPSQSSEEHPGHGFGE